jgi:hypothetical protein
MNWSDSIIVPGVLVLCAGVLIAPVSAEPVTIRITVQNTAPANDISFAPLRIGFHSGVYDAFDNGETATDPIISIAEGGSGSDWFPAFAAADPAATLGTVVGSPQGPLLPGVVASTDLTVDPAINPYFTFASMVVPSNDHFIGNDNPMAHKVLNADGTLAITTITQTGGQIWDAGSEVTDPAAAAFLVIGDNDLKTPENGVVHFNITELDAYNGLTTAAGYVFQRQFNARDEVYRITFEIIAATACPSDLNNDGVVDGADLGLLLAEWGDCSGG